MTTVKICGITNLDDALLAVKFGAGQLGFNFYARSPRYILPELARPIITDLPENVSIVGVFVNETIERIIETAKIARLDAIQLHGDEDLNFADDLSVRLGIGVIKAFRVTPNFRAEDAVEYNAHAILLDGYSPKERGGTGDTFDWEIAQRVSAVVPVLYLAGGLTPENVGDAIRKVGPFAVDVCSRIESSPGKKDPKKVEAFIKAVKETI